MIYLSSDDEPASTNSKLPKATNAVGDQNLEIWKPGNQKARNLKTWIPEHGIVKPGILEIWNQDTLQPAQGNLKNGNVEL